MKNALMLLTTIAAALLWLGGATSLFAQPAAPPSSAAGNAAAGNSEPSGGAGGTVGPARALEMKMLEAYAKAKTYRSTVTFDEQLLAGRLRSIQSIYVAIDREAGKLLVDKPDLKVVVADGKLRLKGFQVPGRYLELDAPSPVTYQWLLQQIPFLGRPLLPDLMMLTGDQPRSVMRNPTVKFVEPPEGDGDDSSTSVLAYKSTAGVMTLRIDAETHLLTAMRIDIDAGPAGAANAFDVPVMVYDIEVLKLDEPLADDTFAFDTTGLTKFDSLQALLNPAPGSGGPGSGGPGSGGPGPAAPTAIDAPPFELDDLDGNTVKLEEIDADVVVLALCIVSSPASRPALPAFDRIHQWTQQENLSAAVYIVSIEESAEQVAKYWKQEKFTVPVLLDAEGKVAEAYNLMTIPKIVVIQEGKIVAASGGFSPDMEDAIKEQIKALLAEGEDASQTDQVVGP